MNQKEKTKFRRTVKWKKFRAFLLKERGRVCELCGTIKPQIIQVHHVHPENYTNLENPLHFKLLCSGCHDLIERFTIKKTWGIKALLWAKIFEDFIKPEIIKEKITFENELH